MTTTGARAMTPGYSPPEQYGTTRTDHRSDLYSLGATLYAAITGNIPEDALARAMGQAELTPIRKRNPRVSQDLACALERALAVRPDERYANARDFKQALLGAETIPGQMPVVTPSEPPDFSDVPDKGASIEIGNNLAPPGSTSWDNTGQNSSRPWYLPRSFRSIILPGLILVLIAVVLLVSSNLPDWVGLASPIISPTQTYIASSSALNLIVTQTLPSGLASPTALSSLGSGATIQGVTPASTRAPSPTLEPTPTEEPQPTPLGGGGGELAFASNQSGTVQVWVTNLDGSNMRQVTDMPEGACQPDWSPDGMKLVFISPCDGNDEIYPGSGLFLINYDGTNLTPLPNMPGGDFDPSWSPDGQYIAFTSRRVSGRSRIYLIDVDTFEVIRLSGQFSRNMQPAWSSDGQMLVYISSTDGPTDIWVMNRDGTNQMAITKNHTKINSHPVWSMDDNVILFTQADEAGGVPHLTSASTNEGLYNELQLNLGYVPAREGKYSPDGLWIAFESWPDGHNHDIYISSAGGAGRSQITNLPSMEFDPSWRPVSLPH
jgi:Tol biopolymer transport system component